MSASSDPPGGKTCPRRANASTCYTGERASALVAARLLVDQHPPQEFDLSGVVDVVERHAVDHSKELVVRAAEVGGLDGLAEAAVSVDEEGEVVAPGSFGRRGGDVGPVAALACELLRPDQFVDDPLFPVGGVEHLLPDALASVHGAGGGRGVYAAEGAGEVGAVPRHLVEAPIEEVQEKVVGVRGGALLW